MEKISKGAKPVNTEELGIPTRKLDPMGTNEMLVSTYSKMAEDKRSKSLWVKILAIILSLIIFIFPSVTMLLLWGDDGVTNLATVILSLVFISVGGKIIYSNIKSIYKNR